MKYFLTFIIFLTSFSFSNAQDNFCGIHNTSFLPGEQITYEVFYNLGKLYVGAGQATFNTTLDKMDGHVVYHITGEGKTYKSYDWFYKVRDMYESYVDTATMLPVKFVRNVNEGGYRIYNNVTFNQEAGTAVSTNGVFKIPSCVQDVLSAVYYARNIDYNKYKPGDKIPFDMFLDDKIYHLYIRYMGKTRVTTQFGTFNAILIKPLLVAGTIFKGGEQMSVWVSDDKNHIPVRINSPISVGSIKVDMVAYKNIRYPFTSLLDREQ